MKLMHVGLVLIAVLLVSCNPTASSTKVCQTDSDCVPAQCCHATDAVNKGNAPDCTAMLCTLECAPGTIDCGQGSVACITGLCTVKYNDQ